MINNVKDAIILAYNHIKKNERIISCKNIMGEWGIRGQYIKTEKNKYLVYFRKNPYHSFSYFENGKRIRGWGVSNAKENLEMFRDSKIICVFSDEKMYVLESSVWIDWSVNHNTIQRPEDRKNRVDGFTYYNIPLNIMERMNPDV